MHLLMLDPSELGVVHTALVYFASHCDDEGDTYTAKIADAVSDRTGAMERITHEAFLDFARSVGVGRWKGRAQG